MEGSTLDIAYALARKADMATQKGDYSNASALHSQASQKFTEAIAFTNSSQARTMLESLSKTHLTRSKFLADKKNLISSDSSRLAQGVSSVPKEELMSSLGNARGIRAGGVQKKDDLDPFSKAYSSINSSFTKTLNSFNERAGDGNLGETIRTNESFYVVPVAATNNNNVEELNVENANLRQMLNRTSTQLYAYETAMKKHKDILKATLMQLKNDVAARESARNKQHELEIEQLRTENDKLKIKIGRLKSRWDSQKESSGKRREDEG